MGSRYGLFFSIERISISQGGRGRGTGSGAEGREGGGGGGGVVVGGGPGRRRANGTLGQDPEVAAYLEK